MGGLLCKQRSRSRPPHTAQSRRKKLHGVGCLLRAPCLLCFIVHGEHPTREAPSPDLPADQDCARLLLLCPGELSACQERQTCGGLVRGPGLLCPATDDMVCKRKNCGENQQPLTPCKQPRCAPAREQTHPLEEDLSPHPEDLSPHPEDLSLRHENLSPHPEDLSPNLHHEGLSPHLQDLSPCPHHEEQSPHCEDPSPCSGGATTHPQPEDLPPYRLTDDPSLCPGGDIAHSISKDLSSCTGEGTIHSKSRERSSWLIGGSIHPKTRDVSLCPKKEAKRPQHADVSLNSGGQAQSLSGGLTRPLLEVLEPSSTDSEELCGQGKWHLTGDPALACTEALAHSTPGNWLQHSIADQHPSLSGDLTTPFVEDQEPHCSGVKTLQSQEEGNIPGDSGFSCTGEDAHQITRDSAMFCTELQCKPVHVEPLHLDPEDLGQPFCCSNTPSPLAAPCHVEVPSPGCNQAAPSQSPKVEGEVLVPCEPLHINQLPPSLLLKIFSLLSLNQRCLSASLVCKYWRDLCLDFQFWKQLDLSSRQQVKDNLLEKIASRCWNITEINISDCLNVTDAGICKLAMNCSGLLKYTAYRCKQLSDLSLISLATHCPSLQKVHVGNQDRLTDKALDQLGSRCIDLRDIHFGQCYKISDEGMVVIAKGCPKLQKIYMQENKLVTNRSVEAFAEHCPELQYVGFMGCSVTSHGVIHLTRLKNLSSLDLRNITELDNQTVVEIVKKCQNLTSLNLCLNRNIDDRCVEVIAKEGRSLKELYLVTCKITDHALIAIGRYSTTIETVDVGWCKEITDQGATLIAQSSKSIRYLGLMRCDQVNENTVEQLVQQYPHITFSTVLQDCKRTLERAYQMGWTPNASSAS